jgi:hypothetical protein
VGVADEEYHWEGTGIRTLYGTLSFWVAVSHDVDTTLYASYTHSALDDASYDERSLNAGAGLIWYLRRDPPRISLGADVGYTRYAEKTWAVRYDEVYGLIVLRVAAF